MKNIVQLKEYFNNLKDACFEDWFYSQKSSLADDSFMYSMWPEYDEDSFDNEVNDLINSQDIDSEKVDSFKKEYFENQLKEKSKNVYDDQFWNFLTELDEYLNIENDVVTVYRAMNIPKNQFDQFIHGLNNNSFINDYLGIGVCWSFNKNKAEAHHGHVDGPSIAILITGHFPLSSLNLKRTFELNMDLSCGFDEAELRINDHELIHITEIENLEDSSVMSLNLLVNSGI